MSKRDKVINDFEAFKEEPDGLIVVGAGVMDELSTWKARAEKAEREVNGLKMEVVELDAEADELMCENSFIKVERDKFKEDYEISFAEWQTVVKTIEDLKAERDTLKARCEKLEGYARHNCMIDLRLRSCLDVSDLKCKCGLDELLKQK